MLQCQAATCNSFKTYVQSLQEVEPSSTVSVTWYNFLHDIFFATCLETLEKEIHCKLQKTCYMLQCQAATCNSFKTYVQSLQEVEPSSTVSVTGYNFLHDIFLATCLETLEKEIHCKLQKTCHMLQCQAATCNGFKTYVQ